MNKKWFVLLVVVCVLCFVVSGCAQKDVPDASAKESEPIASSQMETGSNQTQTDPNEEVGTGVVVPGEDALSAGGDQVPIASEGKLRISYTGKRSSVAYVTSVSDLPNYSELKQYDDAYFEEHALLLVTETVSSGSIDVGILSVNIKDSAATVTLYHEMPEEGTYGTDDMATWLIWAEVETGLDCQWTVANPALQPDSVAY